MMYPQYSNRDMCGGVYDLYGCTCEWQVTHEVDRVVARIYGDYRYEGRAFTYPTRREALEGLADMIYAEVA